MSEHPTVEELARFIAEELPPPRTRAVVEHLVRGCRRCRNALAGRTGIASFADPPAAADRPAAGGRDRRRGKRSGTGAGSRNGEYDRAIASAFATARRHSRRLRLDKARAQRVRDLLQAQGIAGFLGLPRHLSGVPACQGCLDLAWSLRQENPPQMVQLAQLATLAARRLPPAGHGDALNLDLRCRAEMELANAYRVVSRFREAGAALSVAADLFRRGSRDPFLAARLLEIKANICGDRCNFLEAFRALNGAARIYRRYGQPHLAGRMLIEKGLYSSHAGEPEKAIALLRKGLEMIDPAIDPQLALAAVHNVAVCMVDRGDFRPARLLLWRHLQLFEEHAGLTHRLRLAWLKGRIHEGLREYVRAERAFVQTREDMSAAGDPYAAATATLDLAALMMRRGEAERAHALAREAAQVYFTLDLGRETTAAVMLLEATLEFQKSTTAGLFKQVADFMRQAASDKSLSFRNYFS